MLIDKSDGSVLRTSLVYVFTPRISSLIRGLSRYLSFLAYLIASTFATFKIIPRNHPTLNPQNIGRYGIGYVFTSALNNLIFTKKNIDQILVFIAVCMTFVLGVLQIIAAFFFALALPTTAHAKNIFVTPAPYDKTDLSLQLLQHAFGLGTGSTAFFSQTVATGSGGYNAFYNLHQVFYKMMGLYSTGMMIIAVLLVVYYVFAVVGEAAYTGKPFGNRFNGLYAPIRIVLGLGLLVPLGSGLNTAQYLVMYSAKFGVGLANSAWYEYADSLASLPLSMNVVAETQSTGALTEAVFKGVMCKKVRALFYHEEHIAPYLLITKPVYNRTDKKNIEGLTDGSAMISELASWKNTEANIVFTPEGDGTSYTSGNYCGKISLDIRLSAKERFMAEQAWVTNKPYVRSASEAQQAAFTAFLTLLKTINDSSATTEAAIKLADGKPLEKTDRENISKLLSSSASTYDKAVQQTQAQLDTTFSSINNELSASGDLVKDMKNGGWAIAGAYYSMIGRYIRFLSEAATMPMYKGFSIDRLYWEPAKEIGARNIVPSQDAVRIEEASKKIEELSQAVSYTAPTFTNIAENKCRRSGVSALFGALSGGNWMAAIDFIFDTCTLREMRASKTLDPMYYLVRFGNEKVSRSLYIISASLGIQLASARFDGAREIAELFGGVANFIAFLGLGIGITLAYMLPLLPFIYYMVAILSWVLAIFQALLGLPLWALAHIRIEGDGIAGPVAENGYKFLLEIMLRPVLILLTLIGVFFIIGAANYFVSVLFVTSAENTSLIMLNDDFNAMENLVMTLLYAVMMYGIINTLVKLTDTLPQTVMSWGGLGAAYNDPLNGGVYEGHSTAFLGGMYTGLQQVNQVGTNLGKTLQAFGKKSPMKVEVVDGTPHNSNDRGGPR